jgi:hypothetical protein
MGIIKLLLSIILLAVVGLGGLYVAENRGLVPKGTFANVINKAKTLPLPAQVANIQSPQQAANFVSQQTASITSKNASGSVLGAVSNAASSVNLQKQDPPLTQRAFEYGRYIYCQQVVNDYQSRNQGK